MALKMENHLLAVLLCMCTMFAGICIASMESRWRTYERLFVCPKPLITVRNGTKQQCSKCPICRKGWGSSVDCGDILKEPKSIGCVRCKKLHTFSPKREHGSCRPCRQCKRNHEVVKKCKRVSDAVCGGCKHGYYREFFIPWLPECEECSWCCGDRTDKIIKQCSDMGMPLHKQCSYLQKKKCKRVAEATLKMRGNHSTQTLPNTTHMTTAKMSTRDRNTAFPQQGDYPFVLVRVTTPSPVRLPTENNHMPKTAFFVEQKNTTKSVNNLSDYSKKAESPVTKSLGDINVNNVVTVDYQAGDSTTIIMSLVGCIAGVIAVGFFGYMFYQKVKKSKDKNTGSTKDEVDEESQMNNRPSSLDGSNCSGDKDKQSIGRGRGVDNQDNLTVATDIIVHTETKRVEDTHTGSPSNTKDYADGQNGKEDKQERDDNKLDDCVPVVNELDRGMEHSKNNSKVNESIEICECVDCVAGADREDEEGRSSRVCLALRGHNGLVDSATTCAYVSEQGQVKSLKETYAIGQSKKAANSDAFHQDSNREGTRQRGGFCKDGADSRPISKLSLDINLKEQFCLMLNYNKGYKYLAVYYGFDKYQIAEMEKNEEGPSATLLELIETAYTPTPTIEQLARDVDEATTCRRLDVSSFLRGVDSKLKSEELDIHGRLCNS